MYPLVAVPPPQRTHPFIYNVTKSVPHTLFLYHIEGANSFSPTMMESYLKQLKKYRTDDKLMYLLRCLFFVETISNLQ